MSAPGHVPERPAGPAAPPWPRLPMTFVALAAVLVLTAGAAGWLGRGVTSPESPAAAASRPVELGAVALTAPGAWTPVRGPVSGLPELGTRFAAFAPVPGLDGRAVLTLAPFDDPTLVPDPLQALVTGAPRRAKLAGLPAWTYKPRELPKGQIAQVTVAPTTAGSLALVCIGPSATWSGGASCSDGLAGATLRDATPLVPSSTLVFRRRLAPVLDAFGARRAELRAKLRGATTRRGQARFARRLGRAHVKVATALAPLAPAAGAPLEVIRELRRGARGYGQLATAARAGWPKRYHLARVAIKRSDRALAAAVKRVR